MNQDLIIMVLKLLSNHFGKQIMKVCNLQVNNIFNYLKHLQQFKILNL